MRMGLWWMCPICETEVNFSQEVESRFFDKNGKATFDAGKKNCIAPFHVYCQKCRSFWVLELIGHDNNDDAEKNPLVFELNEKTAHPNVIRQIEVLMSENKTFSKAQEAENTRLAQADDETIRRRKTSTWWQCPRDGADIYFSRELEYYHFGENGEAIFDIGKDGGIPFLAMYCQKCDSSWIMTLSGLRQ